jgi:hypothetical protein
MVEQTQVAGAQTQPRGASRRPGAVTVVAWLYVIQAVLTIAFAAMLIVGLLADVEATMSQLSLVWLIRAAVLMAVGGLALIAAAVGLFLLKSWAWTLAMATQCWTLTNLLFGYLMGQPSYPLMALGALIVFLLNQKEVHVVFEDLERNPD